MVKPEQLDRLISSTEAAKLLKVSYMGFYNYLRRKQIQAYRIGNRWYTTREDIADYLNRGSNIKSE